jgi:hypothetical protein
LCQICPSTQLGVTVFDIKGGAALPDEGNLEIMVLWLASVRVNSPGIRSEEQRKQNKQKRGSKWNDSPRRLTKHMHARGI